jgi:protein-tyrosine phosphatase
MSDVKWYGHETDKINLEKCKCASPFDNIYITPTPRDGLTKESADSFDAIINVSHSPEVLFQPSRPDQRTYWYPVNELGEWSYAYFAYMFKVLDYHHGKNHKMLIHCHAGAYRSPTIVRCWLRYKGYCVEEAYDIVTGYMRDFSVEKDDGRFRNFALFQGYKLGNYPPNFDLYIERLRYHKDKSYSYIAALEEPNKISLRPETLPRGYHYRSYMKRKYLGWYMDAKSWLRDRKEQFALFLVGERRVYISKGYSTVIYPDEPVANFLRRWLGSKKHPHDDITNSYRLKKDEFIRLERDKEGNDE